VRSLSGIIGANVPLDALIRAAHDGDEAAWGTIVDQFSGLVWATARAHRLSAADAADVAQTTWLRLVENLDRVQNPQALGAWLATTARRECLRLIRLRGRELATDDAGLFDAPGDDTIDQRLIIGERDRALARALRTIGERCQALLRMLASPEPPSYEEISAALEMPIGAIGPTRARCLDKLRRSPELTGIELR
jgi:RNA polymerase sigma factor (sigma-70 family)